MISCRSYALGHHSVASPGSARRQVDRNSALDIIYPEPVYTQKRMDNSPSLRLQSTQDIETLPDGDSEDDITD